jgi:hypothetical protein
VIAFDFVVGGGHKYINSINPTTVFLSSSPAAW